MKLKPRKKSCHEWQITAARIKKAKKEERNATFTLPTHLWLKGANNA